MSAASGPAAARDAMQAARIEAFLNSPASYVGEATNQVERVETHISAVFLTDRFAYKLKKRVDFGFADFTTLERRRRACEAELTLNRRLAPEVYLDVVPIRETPTGYQLNGAGTIVDWLVKMRRLDASDSLLEKIRRGEVSEDDVDRLGQVLCDFYRGRPPLHPVGYAAEVERHVRDNAAALEQHVALDTLDAKAQVRRIHAAQLRLLRLKSAWLQERVEMGRVIDGHGDLRPEHIYYTPDPTIIDCIEFNDELRRLDVLDELAFLAEECEHVDAGWIGDRLLAQYLADSGDAYPAGLLDFYKAYRACVRAKVAALRAASADPESRRRFDANVALHLNVAEKHTRRISPPFLLVVFGLSGVGKSTVARRLSDDLAVPVLSTDHIRRTLFGSDQTRSELYRPEQRLEVYGELHRQARTRLTTGESVILDGTFASTSLQRATFELANRCGAAALFVQCVCDEETAIRRIAVRAAQGNSESDATADVHRVQREQVSSPAPELPLCRVDTGDSNDEAVRTAIYDALAAQVHWRH